MAEVILLENSASVFHFPELFETSVLSGDHLSDYCGVNFSLAAFQHLNFFKKFLLTQKCLSLVMMRLVDLFPPQIPEGGPFTSRWVRKTLSGFFNTN